jgi:hypothetical protein
MQLQQQEARGYPISLLLLLRFFSLFVFVLFG